MTGVAVVQWWADKIEFCQEENHGRVVEVLVVQWPDSDGACGLQDRLLAVRSGASPRRLLGTEEYS